jgi:excisionase family DNA binding protein
MSKPPPPDETAGPLFTIAEVADRLRVNEKTVRRWIDTQELPAFKLGRQWRISEQGLRRFLRMRQQG